MGNWSDINDLLPNVNTNSFDIISGGNFCCGIFNGVKKFWFKTDIKSWKSHDFVGNLDLLTNSQFALNILNNIERDVPEMLKKQFEAQYHRISIVNNENHKKFGFEVPSFEPWRRLFNKFEYFMTDTHIIPCMFENGEIKLNYKESISENALLTTSIKETIEKLDNCDEFKNNKGFNPDLWSKVIEVYRNEQIPLPYSRTTIAPFVL